MTILGKENAHPVCAALYAVEWMLAHPAVPGAPPPEMPVPIGPGVRVLQQRLFSATREVILCALCSLPLKERGTNYGPIDDWRPVK